MVDREAELAEIEATIRNRAKLFLIGPRRFGKTSLLFAAADAAERQGVVVLRLDAEKYESLPLLAQALLTGAARALKGPVERTLQSLFEAGEMRYEPEALEAILDIADDVPYNVQRLAHECWEWLRGGEAPALTPAVVRAAAERIVRKEDPAYTQIWTQLSRNQKKALKAVVTYGGERLQSGAVSAELGMSASSMQAALGALEAAHLIRPVEDRGQVRYRPVDPFLAVWLAVAQGV